MTGLARRRSAAAHVFVDDAGLDGAGPIPLDEPTAHHLRRVLRLRPGAEVTVTDGRGRWCPTVLADSFEHVEPTGPVEVEVRVVDPFTIATAIPKGDRVEILVQKVTELGADRVVLLHTDRSVVRWDPDRSERNRARLQRIADEACRQSRRVWSVVVEGPVDARSVLPNAVIAEPGGRNLTQRDDLMAIGPEGGWTDREIELATASVDLGSTILRTETAAIAAATLRGRRPS